MERHLKGTECYARQPEEYQSDVFTVFVVIRLCLLLFILRCFKLSGEIRLKTMSPSWLSSVVHVLWRCVIGLLWVVPFLFPKFSIS